jgi:hypothetical protein
MWFGGQLIAVALEQSRGSLVFMLTKYEHLVIFPVHPGVAQKWRDFSGYCERNVCGKYTGAVQFGRALSPNPTLQELIRKYNTGRFGVSAYPQECEPKTSTIRTGRPG